MSRPVVCITGEAAAAILIPTLIARQESSRDAQFFKDQPPTGLVGVWLDAESRKKMAARFPRLAGASAVLLQSPSLAGVDAFEPLYGTRALCRVMGVASGDDADAVSFKWSSEGLLVAPTLSCGSLAYGVVLHGVLCLG